MAQFTELFKKTLKIKRRKRSRTHVYESAVMQAKIKQLKKRRRQN